MFLHKMCVLFKWYMSQKTGTHFLGKKNACGKTVGGIVLVRMTLKLKELFDFLELSIRVDLGTVKGHWGKFPRRKIMIGVWRTRLDGSRGPNKPSNSDLLRKSGKSEKCKLNIIRLFVVSRQYRV